MLITSSETLEKLADRFNVVCNPSHTYCDTHNISAYKI